MERTMMNEKGLSKYFWAEAVHTAVYIFNSWPTMAFEEKTSVDVWSDMKPYVYHFNFSECIYYGHKPTEKRINLNGKSQNIYISCLYWCDKRL